MKQPWTFGLFPRIRDLSKESDQDLAEIPEWLRDYPWATVGRDGEKLKIVSMRNVFTVDILPDILPGMSGDSIRQWIASSNPILTMIPEMILGRDLYFNRDLTQGKILGKGLESEVFRSLPGIKQFLNPREVVINDKNYVKVNARAWHAMTRLWYGRLFRELDSAFAAAAGKAPLTEGILGLATGFKLQQIDTERQLGILNAEGDKVYADYRSALRQGDASKANDILEEFRLK